MKYTLVTCVLGLSSGYARKEKVGRQGKEEREGSGGREKREGSGGREEWERGLMDG